MIIVNKPTKELMDVKCYKCSEVFQVHPMQDSSSPFIIDCELHKPKCGHEKTECIGAGLVNVSSVAKSLEMKHND